MFNSYFGLGWGLCFGFGIAVWVGYYCFYVLGCVWVWVLCGFCFYLLLVLYCLVGAGFLIGWSWWFVWCCLGGGFCWWVLFGAFVFGFNV